jgi:hypothetical protein
MKRGAAGRGAVGGRNGGLGPGRRGRGSLPRTETCSSAVQLLTRSWDTADQSMGWGKAALLGFSLQGVEEVVWCHGAWSRGIMCSCVALLGGRCGVGACGRP